jgi:pimeloyl-ACP methyl ester carboxylesterase
MNEQFADVGRGITLCYEEFGDPSDPPMLLIMGLATQMIGWHEDFCRELAERGFHVVRFDNRDVGRSTHLDGQRPPTPRELWLRRMPEGQYSLSDMATDALELMRHLEMEPAHVVGVSMGGMIGQTLAVEHPESIRSFVSMISNTGSRISGQPSLAVYRHLLGRPPRTREEAVERAAKVFGVIGSKYEGAVEYIRERAGQSFDRGHNAAGPGRQLGAIVKTGNRTKSLRRIKAPTLVIHGARDKMVATSGGRATAKAIPGARLEIIQGMGHDLPRPKWPRLIDLISGHAHAADAAAGREAEPVATPSAT